MNLFLDSELKLTIAIQSVAITIATLGAYMLGLQWYGNQEEGVAIARTMAFATLIISELLRSYSARSIKDTLFSIGIFSNRKLVWATLLSLALTLVVMEIPGVRELFKLTPLSLKDWVVILVGALIPLALGEIQK